MLSITQKQAKRWRPKRSLKICVVVACCFARYGADTRLHRIARGARVQREYLNQEGSSSNEIRLV